MTGVLIKGKVWKQSHTTKPTKDPQGDKAGSLTKTTPTFGD